MLEVLGVGEGVVCLVHVERVPGGVLEDGEAVPVGGDALNRAGELAETEGVDLGAVEEGREEEVAGGIVEGCEDFVDGVDLSVCETAGKSGVVGAGEDGGVEVALGWVFEDAVRYAVDGFVTLR